MVTRVAPLTPLTRGARRLAGWAAAVWVLGVLGSTAAASDPDKPHPHQGVLQAVTGPPAAAALSPEDIARLESGETVQRHLESDDGGSGVAVLYIAAPPDLVWDTILSYDRYVDWVDNVESCTVYRREGHDLYVDMQNSVWGLDFGFYTRNTVRRDLGYMSWTLDYERESDVSDMVGYWRVESLRESPPLTRLEYSTRIHMRGVPGFLVRYLTRDALADGTAWVKVHAEAAFKKGK